MSQYINRNYRQTIPFWIDIPVWNILLVDILTSQVLSEAQSFRHQPCLLKLNQYQLLRTVIILYGGSKIYPHHRDFPLCHSRIFMRTHFKMYDFLLKQGRKHYLCHPVVFHHILEHRIVYRICYQYHKKLLSLFVKLRKDTIFFMKFKKGAVKHVSIICSYGVHFMFTRHLLDDIK